MELLYFISGILSVGVIYSVKLLRSVKSSHTEMLARHQSQSNISSIRSIDVDEAIEDLRLLVSDIQSNMEKDQYTAVSEINQKLKELDNVVYKNTQDLKQSNQVFNKNVTDAFNEIMQLKNSIKILVQDPNMTSNY
jgi:hypothetical protein